MLEISCPWCGLRDESEFSYGGEAHIVRPVDPDALSDEQWADYLFHRTNTKGLFREQWLHAYGCRKWFYVVRDTVTYKIHAVYKVGEEQPQIEGFSVSAGGSSISADGSPNSVGGPAKPVGGPK